ncbi:unnamed protein product, partial [marine sediment metagenome]
PCLDVKFLLQDVTVKYTAHKYGKPTITLDEDTKCFFDFEKLCTSSTGCCNFIKGLDVSLKLGKNLDKEKMLEDVMVGDLLDIVVNFNGIWDVGTGKYASLELIQYQKAPIKEVQHVNYFTR